MEVSENCVYTIVEGEKLKDVVNHAGSETFSEKKRWVTGLQLLNESLNQGKEMLVLFADAADCTKLLYWSFLKNIELSDEGTSYTVKRLYVLKGHHIPQELSLLSTENNIAEGHIRPYVLCHTPEFFLDENKVVY